MELPTITKTAGYNTVNYASAGVVPLAGAIAGNWIDRADEERGIGMMLANFNQAEARPVQTVAQRKAKPMSKNRIVKVFIVDPSDAIPTEKRVLYQGSEKFTDATDQELFFEVPINELLTRHNEYRKTVTDRKASEKFGRDIFLEPVRISALAMAVVDVASF